ncbi:MAG: hypothetical protein ABI871_06680, partial [Chthoniobacterales bacterium]
ISTHNAYHTGQILYVRKLQGSWNPANGVKQADETERNFRADRSRQTAGRSRASSACRDAWERLN